MLEMSFYDGTLNRKEAIEKISTSNKPCKYTYGLTFRNPTTHNKPILKEEAIEIIRTESLLDITEKEDCFYLNAYSANDMW